MHCHIRYFYLHIPFKWNPKTQQIISYLSIWSNIILRKQEHQKKAVINIGRCMLSSARVLVCAQLDWLLVCSLTPFAVPHHYRCSQWKWLSCTQHFSIYNQMKKKIVLGHVWRNKPQTTCLLPSSGLGVFHLLIFLSSYHHASSISYYLSY